MRRSVLAAVLCGVSAAALAQSYPPGQDIPARTVPAPQLGNALGTLVATQTVTGAASIAFTGLSGTAKYHLSCHGIQPATNAVHLYLRVGEGATPTWETGGNYFVASQTLNANSGTASIVVATTSTAVDLTFINSAVVTNGANYFAGYEITFGDLAQTGYKSFDYTGHWWNTDSPAHLQNNLGSGAWTGDTAAITAVEILASSGNITGTCNLFQLGGS